MNRCQKGCLIWSERLWRENEKRSKDLITEPSNLIIYKENNNRPSTVPCGIPEVRLSGFVCVCVWGVGWGVGGRIDPVGMMRTRSKHSCWCQSWHELEMRIW